MKKHINLSPIVASFILLTTLASEGVGSEIRFDPDPRVNTNKVVKQAVADDEHTIRVSALFQKNVTSGVKYGNWTHIKIFFSAKQEVCNQYQGPNDREDKWEKTLKIHDNPEEKIMINNNYVIPKGKELVEFLYLPLNKNAAYSHVKPFVYQKSGEEKELSKLYLRYNHELLEAVTLVFKPEEHVETRHNKEVKITNVTGKIFFKYKKQN